VPRVYVGAGSNSDPGPRLRAAVAALERVFGAVCCSAVYRSTAVSGAVSTAAAAAAPDYLNIAVGFDSGLGPARVKAELMAIEAAGGRRRDAGRAPVCPIDLDLLIYGARVDAPLRLPHPDVLRRAFVLGPLVDVAPDLRHPVTGEPLAAAWRRGVAAGGGLERVGEWA
jgi:2-amino-4-hydroxy-6-hydroxymethyldihydropteridine diphosphokinase